MTGELKHLLSVEQFTRDSVEQLLHVARRAEPIARRQKICRILEGAVLANLFFEASTRTRLSFGAAFSRLGGAVCDTTGFTFSSMAKGESIYDTSRVVSGYVDAIVVRHPEKGSVAQFAEATYVPVINGGDGAGEHPSQALLDLYTIKNEFARLNKELDGAHVVCVGDLKYGRTVHSLVKLLSLYKNIRFTLISPKGLEMPTNICDTALAKNHVVEIRSKLQKPLKRVDIIYATRIQKERMETEGQIEGYSSNFRVNIAFLNTYCDKDAVVMHPLPRDSTPGANDLSTDLNRDLRLAIFRQSDGGVAVRMAIFAVLLGIENLITKNLRDVTWYSPERLGVDDPDFYTLAYAAKRI